MFVELIILFVITVLLYDYLSKKRRNDMISDLPGPIAWPLIGCAIRGGRFPNNDGIMNLILSDRHTYGNLYRLWLFNQLLVNSTEPKDIEVVLSSQKLIRKNNLYDILLSWLGTGLLLSSGQKWHSRRKIITPTFHFKILEQFVDVFDQQSAVMIKKLAPLADGKTAFNIHPKICSAALDIIAETAMGTKINAQTDSDCAYVKAVTDVSQIMSSRFIYVLHRNDTVFKYLAPKEYARQSAALKALHDFTENIIETRRKALNESIADGTYRPQTEDDIGSKKKMALLDVLLQTTIDGKPLTNADIREEVDTFMFEGHDTTTSGISFALYLISRHPEVQQKLFEEIRENIGDDKDRPVGYKDLLDMKYLECVIKEALRMYPPVPVIGRYFEEDVNINGRMIPAGTNFNVEIFSMLRREDLFPKADSFIPERHLAENSSEKTNPYAYIPFSAGPRNCIGQKFATFEMKSTITKVLRHYELLPLGPEVKPTLNLVMRSSNGINVGLKMRVY